MAEEEDWRRPVVSYSDDPRVPESYVRVLVDIPGLQKTFLGSKPANADIILKTEERSFSLKVTLHGNAKPNKYEYSVKQLPDPILTDESKSFTKVKRKGEVVVMLHKAQPRRWDVQLESQGLETATDE